MACWQNRAKTLKQEKNDDKMRFGYLLHMQKSLLLTPLLRHPAGGLNFGSSQKDQKLVFKTNYRLIRVKSTAECSKGRILQYS